jgi:hypothetical protein
MKISLKGAIDLHVHSEPELFERIGTAYEIAQQAVEAGMAAIAFKAHHESTVDRCRNINLNIPGFTAIAGITLNRWIGGYNVEAVKAALKLGAKMVWMPSMHTAYHNQVMGNGYGIKSMTVDANELDKGMTIWGEDGKISPALLEIMSLVQQARGILGTSHFSPVEIEVLAKKAKEMGVKVLVNHVFFMPRGIDIPYLKRLVDSGAVLELAAVAANPMAIFQGSDMTVQLSKGLIEAVGPENCVLATDGGQPFNPWPHEALRIFAQVLYDVGIPQRHLEMMMVENPAKLLEV